MTLIINSFIVPVHATGVVSDNLQNTFKISSANDFPKEIKKDQVYILTNDITLNTGQQIENLEGTLDGKGFKITITVNPGDVEPIDINKLVTQGIEGAIKFINKNYKDGYSYGDEWLIYSLLHAGETIEKDKLDVYYNSVVKEVKTWSNAKKPTDIERVALSLSILGKDITNIEGVNLAEMIYNSKNLKNGSNELAYALIALDAKNTTIPDTALWIREEMISELLKFQNPQTGGFTRNPDDKKPIEMTTMQAFQGLNSYQGYVNGDIWTATGYLYEFS